LEVYRGRRGAVLERMAAAGLDLLAVYADREHFANLMYLTGFDPRFEEALLLLDRSDRARLLVGNECMGYLPDPDLGIPAELFQDFSLPGQPRGSSRPLRKVLEDFGVGPGCRIGCTGWKTFEHALVEGGRHAMEVPAYLVDLLRDMTGARERVENAGGIFMDPQDGLRRRNEPPQIALYEYAAARTSESVLALLRGLREHVEERELERFLDAEGLPLTCHRMISFGDKVRRGLSSATNRAARLGDPYTVAFGVLGALTCRAGCVARGPQDLPASGREFYDALARNYFDVLAAWYGSIRVGATGGEVFAAVEALRDPRLFDFAVNPGHYLHLEEWLHSPFSPGSRVELRSGMMLQADIIPVSRGPFYYVNAEDGVVLADVALRDAMAQRHPHCWRRIEQRRAFMRDGLGIALDASVLPLSNIPAWLPPYALDLQRVLVLAGCRR